MTGSVLAQGGTPWPSGAIGLFWQRHPPGDSTNQLGPQSCRLIPQRYHCTAGSGSCTGGSPAAPSAALGDLAPNGPQVGRSVSRRTGGGLGDRSSRPQRIARQVTQRTPRQILRARHKHCSSLRIANHDGLPISTVVTIQGRLGLNGLSRLEPQGASLRCRKRRPGQLLHVDVKKLAKVGRVGHRILCDPPTRVRGIGWGGRPRRDRRLYTPRQRGGPPGRTRADHSRLPGAGAAWFADMGIRSGAS